MKEWIVWVIKNKEWIFSGVGITILLGALSVIKFIILPQKRIKLINSNRIYTSLEVLERNNGTLDDNKEQDTLIYYVSEKEGDTFRIIPRMQYWEDVLLMGRPMRPLWYWWDAFDWDFPNLDIKVQNNTCETLYLTDIVFEVHKSIPNPAPIIYMKAHNLFSTNPRHLDFRNDGWGEIRDLTLRINCSPSHNDNFETFDLEKHFEELGNLDITSMLQNLTGIDFYSFDQEQKELLNQPGYYLTEDEYERMFKDLMIKWFGKYSSGMAYVNGIIEFNSDTINEKNHHYSLLFSSPVYLFEYSMPALPAPPTYQYDIELSTEGKNYNVTKPISQVIKPGETDRFSIKIHAQKSSYHIIDIYMKSISNKKISLKDNLQLSICIPCSGAKFIENQDSSNR